jgi:predicted aconitase with swiveling domain
MKRIKSRPISKGVEKGKLLVSSESISFLGGINPETGEVIDRNHELKGCNIKDKILFIPGGKGSTVGSYVIFQLKKNNVAPKAIICLNAEPIIATGAIISNIPMVDKPESWDNLLNNIEVEVNGNLGEIIVFS